MNACHTKMAISSFVVAILMGLCWGAGSGIAAEPAPGAATTTTAPAKATIPVGHFQGNWVSKTSRFSIDLDVVIAADGTVKGRFRLPKAKWTEGLSGSFKAVDGKPKALQGTLVFPPNATFTSQGDMTIGKSNGSDVIRGEFTTTGAKELEVLTLYRVPERRRGE